MSYDDDRMMADTAAIAARAKPAAPSPALTREALAAAIATATGPGISESDFGRDLNWGREWYGTPFELADAILSALDTLLLAPAPALLRFLDDQEARARSEPDFGPDYFAALEAVRGFVMDEHETPIDMSEAPADVLPEQADRLRAKWESEHSPFALTRAGLIEVLRVSPMHWEVRRPDGAYVMTRMFESADDAADYILAALGTPPPAPTSFPADYLAALSEEG